MFKYFSLSILVCLLGCKAEPDPPEPLPDYCEKTLTDYDGVEVDEYDLELNKAYRPKFKIQGFKEFNLTNNGTDFFISSLKTHGSRITQSSESIQVYDTIIVRNPDNPRHRDHIDHYYLDVVAYPDQCFSVTEQVFLGQNRVQYSFEPKTTDLSEGVKERLSKIIELLEYMSCQEPSSFEDIKL